jgi:CoA:oxalate CoA-transferase
MTGPAHAPGPLEGLRVIDLTHHLGGPPATMALAQMGADVVRFEPPAGDEWRRVDDVQGESRQFHAANRDKRASCSTSPPRRGARPSAP